MVKVYGLVAITCIINGLFDNASTKTSMLDAGMCRSGEKPKLSMSGTIIIQPLQYVSSVKIEP